MHISLRLALRTLAKTPVFTATIVLTLALGIGATTGVFSALDAVLLRPLPFPDSDRLMELGQSNRKTTIRIVGPVRLEDWNRLNSTFQGITGYYTQDDSELSGELPEKVKRAFTAPRFLQVWGVSPALGRDFTPLEEHFGGPTAVLISDRYWRRRFSADPHVIGKALRLGGSSWSIVGVMPASFLFGDRDVDLWSPSPADAPYAQSRESTWFITTGRLKPGVTLAQARADLATVQANLGKQFPATDAGLTVEIRPLKEALVGKASGSLWLIFGSVSLLLLIACTNIAALLLSRATQRQQEISVRFSLGASRASVAAQLLAESFVLALAGAALGVFVAVGASRLFRALAINLPRMDEIRLDWRIGVYSLACAVAATMLCGFLPSLRGARMSLTGSLVHGGRTQVSSRNPVHMALVGIQVALAVTLLSGAGLLLRSFRELSRVAPGFDPGQVLTFHISMSWNETADMKRVKQRTNRILDTLRSVPGVESAATSAWLPGVPTQFQSELKASQSGVSAETKIVAETRYVTPGYFAVLRIPLLAGAMCRDDEDTPGVLVNRSFVNSFLNGAPVIGNHISHAIAHAVAGEVRGIVGDVRELGLNRPPVPTVYWCTGAAQPGTFFLVRTHGNPAAFAETLRRKIHEIEPRRSVYDLTPLGEHIGDAFAENRLRTILLTFFAVTAVSLACIGLYGTLSYLVSVRQREIGLRLALGALRGRIISHFLIQGLGVSFLGCLAGLVLATLSGRLLTGMLYGVSPSDAITLAGSVFLVLTVALAASLVPAVRAARLDPMQVLREE